METVLFNLKKITCSINNWSLLLICYICLNHIQRLNEISIYFSPFCFRFFNLSFLMSPQIVSNWKLNSFLVGKIWRSERRRWDGLSPHWSHESRQQGSFLEFMSIHALINCGIFRIYGLMVFMGIPQPQFSILSK